MDRHNGLLRLTHALLSGCEVPLFCLKVSTLEDF